MSPPKNQLEPETEELNLFSVRKTRSNPAGYIEPLGDNEEVIIERKPSTLFHQATQWDSRESSQPRGAVRKNVSPTLFCSNVLNMH